jgi:hydroxymethylpyrimidine pyrophosphatase-like HAD family hydrolase
VHDQIAATGAPDLLLREYDGRLEYHAPFHLGREVSHVFRGLVDAGEANQFLAAEGHSALRLVDNGEIGPDTHTFHLIPAGVSKARAVAAHMRARGYAREECIGVGDSREDLDVAEVVGRMFLVANAVAGGTSAYPNVERTEAAMSEGFYEAILRSLAESS